MQGRLVHSCTAELEKHIELGSEISTNYFTKVTQSRIYCSLLLLPAHWESVHMAVLQYSWKSVNRVTCVTRVAFRVLKIFVGPACWKGSDLCLCCLCCLGAPCVPRGEPPTQRKPTAKLLINRIRK